METKLSQLVALMEAGEYRKALAFAARFPRLGDQRDAILSGHQAATNPRWYKALGKDPEAIYQAGVAALHARYGKHLTASHQ